MSNAFSFDRVAENSAAGFSPIHCLGRRKHEDVADISERRLMLGRAKSPSLPSPPGQGLFAGSFAFGLVLAVLAVAGLLELRSRMLVAFSTLGAINVLQSDRAKTLAYLIDSYDQLRGDPLVATSAAPLSDPSQSAKFVDELSAIEDAAKDEAQLKPFADKYVKAANASLGALREARVGATGDQANLAAAAREVAAARGLGAAFSTVLDECVRERRKALQNDISRIALVVGALIAGVALVSVAQGWELLALGRKFFTAQSDSALSIAQLSHTLSESREALDVVNRRLTLAMRSAHVVVFSIKPDGTITWSHDAGRGVFGGSASPFSLASLAPEADRARILEHVASASRSKDVVEFEMTIARGNLDQGWLKVTLLPLEGEEEGGLLGSAVDLTDMKRRDEGNVLLLRELSHRSKNLLAIVQAMARQTAKTAGTPVEFYERFSARLRSLAAGHDLLVKTIYTSADLRELILTQIGALEDLVGSRVFAEGPPVRLRPEATQNLGMALHELATNAQIHGAMTNALGRIHINWRLEGSGAKGRVIVDWIESNGPTVAPSDRRGFGSTLILENLPRSLHGEVTLGYLPEGVRCHMDLPFKYTIESGVLDENGDLQPEPSSV